MDRGRQDDQWDREENPERGDFGDSGDSGDTEGGCDSVGRTATTATTTAKLLRHPALWRAGALVREVDALPTGFDILDRHLPGGGWPRAGLSELMLPSAGIGELRLLLPALKALSRQNRWIAWVNPPFIPYAPALSAAGVDISKILLIHPRTHKDALWSLERATRSGTCSAALAWLDERELRTKDTRRLQLAARQGGTLSWLFRPDRARTENSLAELRLAIAPGEDEERLRVSLCKRRGGWPVADLPVTFEQGKRPGEIREQLSLWRRWRAAESPRPAEHLPRFPMPAVRPDADRHVTH